MDPLRNALIAGVLPGALALCIALLAGAFYALRHPPEPPEGVGQPHRLRGAADVVTAFLAAVALGGVIVLSMRLLERYDAWWPINVGNRTPTLVAIAALASGLVAATPARWYALPPVAFLGGAAISWGVRGPLIESPASLAGWVALDAAFVAGLVTVAEAGLRHAVIDKRRVIVLLAVAPAILPITGVLFLAGQSVAPRQLLALAAVLVGVYLAVVVLRASAGRLVVRGMGALVVLVPLGMLLTGRTLGKPAINPWALLLLGVACVGLGVAAILAHRLGRWWTLGLATLAVAGVPSTCAPAVQRLGAPAEAKTPASPADYGY